MTQKVQIDAGQFLMKTAAMNLEEVGAYALLLVNACSHEDRFDDPRALARLWRVHTNKAVALQGRVLPTFRQAS